MATKNNFSLVKTFIRNILAVDFGLICVAGLLSFATNLSFGIILFLLGIPVAGIGAFLGKPGRIDPNNPRNQKYTYDKRPNEALADQISYDTQHTAPQYAFENVMTFAGLIATGLSVPFLIPIMFSK